jgi:hypothetical protein
VLCLLCKLTAAIVLKLKLESIMIFWSRILRRDVIVDVNDSAFKAASRTRSLTSMCILNFWRSLAVQRLWHVNEINTAILGSEMKQV